MNHLAKAEEKRRLEKLYLANNPGMYHNDKRGGILMKGYPYSTNHKNLKKWFRRFSNRKFRRGKNESEDVLNRNQHKKNFDLWWTLF
jgi:hypothetical protein